MKPPPATAATAATTTTRNAIHDNNKKKINAWCHDYITIFNLFGIQFETHIQVTMQTDIHTI